jgi:hypothetical protein
MNIKALTSTGIQGPAEIWLKATSGARPVAAFAEVRRIDIVGSSSERTARP